MDTIAPHNTKADAEPQGKRPKGSEPHEAASPAAKRSTMLTPSRLGAFAGGAALVALIVVLLVRRSRGRSNLKNAVLHLPGQVDSLLRRGVEQLSHVTG